MPNYSTHGGSTDASDKPTGEASLAAPSGSAVYGIIDPDYAKIFTIARLLAWQEGYALAMHGSFTRDLDIVAIPWTDRACEPEHLVRRILIACKNLREQHSSPGTKPHGRKVWTLIFAAFGDPRFVDLSIYPPNTAAHRQPPGE